MSSTVETTSTENLAADSNVDLNAKSGIGENVKNGAETAKTEAAVDSKTEQNENNPEVDQPKMESWAGESAKYEEDSNEDWDVINSSGLPPPPPLPIEEHADEALCTPGSGPPSTISPPFQWAPGFQEWNPVVVDDYNVCWDFSKTGECKRGDKCNWAHVPTMQQHLQNQIRMFASATGLESRPFTGDIIPMPQWKQFAATGQSPQPKGKGKSWNAGNSGEWKLRQNNYNNVKGSGALNKWSWYKGAGKGKGYQPQYNTYQNSWGTSSWGTSFPQENWYSKKGQHLRNGGARYYGNNE